MGITVYHLSRVYFDTNLRFLCTFGGSGGCSPSDTIGISWRPFIFLSDIEKVVVQAYSTALTCLCLAPLLGPSDRGNEIDNGYY